MHERRQTDADKVKPLAAVVLLFTWHLDDLAHTQRRPAPRFHERGVNRRVPPPPVQSHLYAIHRVESLSRRILEYEYLCSCVRTYLHARQTPPDAQHNFLLVSLLMAGLTSASVAVAPPSRDGRLELHVRCVASDDMVTVCLNLDDGSTLSLNR